MAETLNASSTYGRSGSACSTTVFKNIPPSHIGFWKDLGEFVDENEVDVGIKMEAKILLNSLYIKLMNLVYVYILYIFFSSCASSSWQCSAHSG